MKIAFIVNSFPTISETFILNQITGLIDLGQDVDIFAFRKGDTPKVHPDVVEYNLLNRTFYFDIPKGRFMRLMKTMKIILRYFIFYPAQILRCLNYKKYGGKYFALNNLFKLEPFLRKKYDIVHCHFGPNGNEMTFLKDIFPEIKLITTFHGYDITKIFKKSHNGIYKDLFRKGDLFMPISILWAKKLERLGCPKEKIILHRMGIDVENILCKGGQLNSSTIDILTVARLVEKKGLQYSISAIAKLSQKFSSVNYFIVGDGPLRNELKVLIDRLGLQEKVKLLGSLEHNRVKDLMQKSDIFLLASVTASDGDQEGIPVSLMEAMATGLPVVSTYHSGIPELVIDGKSGFLVPEKDVDALAEKLEYLISHPQIWQEMGKAGRKFVEQNFDIRKLNKRLVEIYKNM